MNKYSLVVEDSGNVCIFVNNVFWDKYANMSEAQNRLEILINSDKSGYFRDYLELLRNS